MPGSKIALVLGGAGNIGSATVAEFLEQQDIRKVVIVSRSQKRIDKAIERVRVSVGQRADDILGFVGDLTIDKEAKTLKEKVIDAIGDKIDFVVSSLGFGYMHTGPLLQLSTDKLKSILDSILIAPFAGYKTFMPLVKNSSAGSYVFVSGGGPDMYLGPGTGAMTIGGSAGTALAKICMKEHAADNVTVSEVCFILGVCPEPDKVPPGPFTWLSTANAGKALVSVAVKRQADGKSMSILSPADADLLAANGLKCTQQTH